MGMWTADELAEIAQVEEVEVAPNAPDGGAVQSVVMWAVTVGDEVFVRSAHGGQGRWYRRALASGTGRFTAGGVSREVTFAPVPAEGVEAVTDAYQAKYAEQPAQFLTPMVEGASVSATVRVTPA